MLSLFKEDTPSISTEEVLGKSRVLLISNLNKGIILSWDNFLLELPVIEKREDLALVKSNFEKLTRWPFLKEILEQDGTEYFFHSNKLSQRLNLAGEKIDFMIPIQDEDWQLWLEIISIHFRQNWNVENPFCSFYGKLYEKTYRLTLIHGSTSPTGRSKLVMRSLSQKPHPIASYGNSEVVVELIKQKENILIVGSTGSGKTSFLTSLLEYVDPNEHLIILEDTYEILSTHAHQTRFISGETPQTSLKAYLAYSLRLSPDRIILGEMRSHEVIPFLMAMNTGHRGLMGTLHASSAHDALHRVALLFSLYSSESSLDFEKVMELLCRNLNYVVFMENKKVKEVIKILGSDKGVAFYENII